MSFHLLDNCSVLRTAAAKKIATLIGKSKRTVRDSEWRSVFFKNGGSFPDSEQGDYQRKGNMKIKLCEAARDYVKSNMVVKGRPNITG